MPIDFSVLTQAPTIAQGFMAGQQAAQQQAEQNRLRDMQMLQMEAQRENVLAQRAQREQQLRERTAAEARTNELRRALESGDEAALIKLGPDGIEAATKLTALNKARGEVFTQRMTAARQFLDTLDPNDPTAPQRYLQWHEANHRDPIIGPMLAARGITADQARSRIEQAVQQGPQAFGQLLLQSKLGTEKFLEMNKPPEPPADVATMKALGIPVTPEGAARFYAMKRPEAPKVDVKVAAFTPASEQAQQDYIKAISKERETLRNVPDTLKNIEAAKKLIPTASTFMGTGGEPLLAAASFLNNRLGMSISTQGVTDATVLRTRLFEGILDNLKKLDSQPSQEQQRVLAQALGNLGTDPAALGQILDRIGETVRDRVDRYNVDVDEAERRGVKFPFKPQIKLPGSATGPANIPGAAPAAPAAAPAAARQVRRTGTLNGRRVIEYTDGSVEYAN